MPSSSWRVQGFVNTEHEMNSRNLEKKIFMFRYIGIIYYIFIYTKEARGSFELEGNPED